MRKTFIAIFMVIFCTPALAEYVKVSDDLTIHYRISGHGPRTILLVPGWLMTADVFEKQFDHYKDSKDYRLISYDPRSQGLSTHTLEGNFYEQHGRDLAAFIKALDLSDITLGGWSNGGFTILSYIHQYGSNKLSALMMIDAAPAGRVDDNKTQWGWFRKDDADKYLEYFTQGSLQNRTVLNSEFAKWMVSEKGSTPAYMEWIDNLVGQTSNSVAALLNVSAYYQDYTTDLAGQEGKIQLAFVTNPEWKSVVEKWSSSHTPSAEVSVMDKHMSFWEKPEQLNVPLDALLARKRSVH